MFIVLLYMNQFCSFGFASMARGFKSVPDKQYTWERKIMADAKSEKVDRQVDLEVLANQKLVARDDIIRHIGEYGLQFLFLIIAIAFIGNGISMESPLRILLGAVVISNVIPWCLGFRIRQKRKAATLATTVSTPTASKG